MPRAAQEGIRPGLPLLEYRDLIDARFKNTDLGILPPGQIPIHPKVYRSLELYTLEFADFVIAKVPESIRGDLAVIEAVVGKLPVSVDDTGIRWLGRDYINEHDVEFDSFWAETNSSGNVWLIDDDSVAINMGIDIQRADMQLIDLPYPSHPMSRGKLKKYMVKPKDFDEARGIITWHTHNLSIGATGDLLFLRSFAIMWNNLGLQRIGAV